MSAHSVYDVTGSHRKEVGVWEITIIMSVLFSSHEFGDSCVIVPPPGSLIMGASVLQDLYLALYFVMKSPAHSGNGVHVLEFDLGAELLSVAFPDRDIDVAAQLPLFHVGVRDPAINKNLLESL